MKILAMFVLTCTFAFGQLQTGGLTAASSSAFDFTAATTFKIPNLSTGGNPGAVPYICDTANFTFCEDTTVGPFVDATNHRVGIRDSAPSTDFQVNGNIALGSSATIPGNNTTGPLIIFTQNGQGIRFDPTGATNETSVFDISGASVRYAALNVDCTGGATTCLMDFNNNTSSGDIRFRTNGGTERVRITSAGSVGIGTASPGTNTLEVINPTATTGATRVQLDLGAADTAPTILFTNQGSSAFSGVGGGLVFKGGSNARTGTGTLSGGTLAVANTSVTANSKVFVQDTGGGTLANIGSLYVASQTAGTGFTVTSSNALDNSTFRYWIFETN